MRRCCLLPVWLLLWGVAAAAPIDDWRQRASAVRKLADNDAPAAYTQALRLRAELPSDAPAPDRVRALNLLARIEIHLGRTVDAIDHAEQAMRDAVAAGDRPGQAEADLNIGLGAVNQNRVERISEVTTHSVAVLEGIDRPDLQSEALFRAAMVYRRVGQLSESATVALQAMDAAQRSGDPLALAYAHHGLAISYAQSQRFAQAVEQFEQMREQARAAGSKLQEGFALLGLGVDAIRRGEMAAGDRQMREAIEAFTAVGTPVNLGYARHSYADQLMAQGRVAEALAESDRARVLFTATQLQVGLFYSSKQHSLIQEALGQRDAASAEARNAYGQAAVLGQPLYRAEAARRLAELAAAAGDHARAYTLA
jgi:tetratricopeptide (TPR) repeat protein